MFTFLKGFSGLLLLLLAVLKVINMVYLLVQGDSDHSTMWFVKQSAYTIAFAMLGARWIQSKPESES